MDSAERSNALPAEPAHEAVLVAVMSLDFPPRDQLRRCQLIIRANRGSFVYHRSDFDRGDSRKFTE